MSTDILKHDHNLLAAQLETLQSTLPKLGEEEFHLLDLFWARLAMHIRAEHLCLFPAILEADRTRFGVNGVPTFEEAERLLAKLKSDHNFFMEQLAEAVKTFRDFLAESERGYSSEKLETISQRVNAVAARLENHNIVEEQLVYAWPQLILNPNDLDDLNASMEKELENLPSRFNERH